MNTNFDQHFYSELTLRIFLFASYLYVFATCFLTFVVGWFVFVEKHNFFLENKKEGDRKLKMHVDSPLSNVDIVRVQNQNYMFR